MTYNNAIEERDFKRINRLNKLTNPKTFWGDVRKITKRITTDRAIRRWQTLAEIRYEEIK